MFYLTKKIIKERPNGFVSALVVGKRSIGKSVYTLKVAAQLYKNLYDLSEDKAYQKAIDSCVFTIKDVLKVLTSHSWKNKADIIIWDDVGVYASGLMYHTNVTGFALLKGLMDTVRTVTHSLLLSTPTQKGVAGFLQNYDDYLVRITVDSDNNARLATGYNRTTLPSGVRRTYRFWKDPFSCHLKSKYYDRYIALRDRYKDELIKSLEGKLKEKQDVLLEEHYDNIKGR